MSPGASLRPQPGAAARTRSRRRVFPRNPLWLERDGRSARSRGGTAGKCNVPVAQAITDEAVLPQRVREALGQLMGQRGTDCWRWRSRRAGRAARTARSGGRGDCRHGGVSGILSASRIVVAAAEVSAAKKRPPTDLRPSSADRRRPSGPLLGLTKRHSARCLVTAPSSYTNKRRACRHGRMSDKPARWEGFVRT